MSATIIPAVDPTYTSPTPKTWARLQNASKKGKIRNVLLSGPTGSGKTSWGIQLAAAASRPLFLLECGTVVEAEQMIGYWEVVPATDGHGSHTRFVLSGFMNAVQTPNAVILLNEINRFQSIKAANALMSILDDTRTLYIPEIDRSINVAPGVTFVATINEGAAYSATDIMDLAHRSRFSRFIRLSWLPEDKECSVLVSRTGIDEVTARKLLKLATHLRKKDPVSLRQLQAAAEEYLDGAGIEEAIVTTFSGVVSDEKLAIMAGTAIGADFDSTKAYAS